MINNEELAALKSQMSKTVIRHQEDMDRAQKNFDRSMSQSIRKVFQDHYPEIDIVFGPVDPKAERVKYYLKEGFLETVKEFNPQADYVPAFDHIEIDHFIVVGPTAMIRGREDSPIPEVIPCAVTRVFGTTKDPSDDKGIRPLFDIPVPAEFFKTHVSRIQPSKIITL